MRIIQNLEFCLNQIELCQLAFERAIGRFDIDAANIACAQKDYWSSRVILKEFSNLELSEGMVLEGKAQP